MPPLGHGWAARLRWPLLWLLIISTGFAGWELTPPGDPNRNWSTSVTLRGVYDDNFNATQNDRQSGLRFGSDVRLRAKVPIEKLFIGLDYDYGDEYPRDSELGGVNQSHNVNVSVNYVFNPRLALSVSETFIQSLEPQLSSPFNVVQAGTYVYDNVVATMGFALTPRWNLSVAESWDIWRYQVSSVASNSDHEDYQTTASAIHTLDPRTSVGLNYQYGRTLFTNPGTNDALNAQSHSLYVSFVRRFNPQLSLQLSGGYSIRESDDGGSSTAPYAAGSLIYNYGPDSAISATVAHSLSEATVGITRDFSTAETTTFLLQVNHRLTARLVALANVSYAFSNFEQPLQTRTLSADEQALTTHLGLTYVFRVWLSAEAGYTYTKLESPDLPGRSYDRNQISLGATLSY